MAPMALILSLGLLALSACAGRAAAPRGRASLILLGGRVWTGDPERPSAQAIAIGGDRILAVGSDAEIERYRAPGVRTIELGGRRVVPGLIDAHVHLFEGGEALLAPDLRSARSEEEFARRLAEAASKLPRGSWVASGSFDHENWPSGRYPSRELLDRFVPEHPVFVRRLDGHMAVANSLALRIAGVTKQTPDPPGGEIVRDPATGEPQGVLKDAAMDLVGRHIPPPDDHARRERAIAALAHAASLGITCLHDMGTSREELRALEELDRRGELTARVVAYVGAEGIARGARSPFLEVRGLKAFADGSLGSSTALFFEPYLDLPEGAPAPCGLAQLDLSEGGELDRLVAGALEADLQPAVHAIGDRAIRAVLDAYERLGACERGARPRIEHAQHIHPDDLARFGRLGVVASMQPYHAADDGRWAEKRIGKARCDTTYAFRDLLDRGARLAFGSDWPVAPLSPFLGMEAAVTRRTLDGRNPDGWVPRQKISLEEALRAYTSGGAYAAFAEARLGTLRPGAAADLAALSEDIFSIEPERIGETRAVLTIVGGRVVWDAGARD